MGNGWASEFDTEQEAAAHEDVWRQFNSVRLTLSACLPSLQALSSLPAYEKPSIGQSCSSSTLQRSLLKPALYSL